ncbi:MAG: lysine biosynthesis protein LysW [Planctomycetota bacterium]
MNACLECGGALELPADPMVGEILACPACGTEMEIGGLAPVELRLAPEIEEDWGE